MDASKSAKVSFLEAVVVLLQSLTLRGWYWEPSRETQGVISFRMGNWGSMLPVFQRLDLIPPFGSRTTFEWRLERSVDGHIAPFRSSNLWGILALKEIEAIMDKMVLQSVASLKGQTRLEAAEGDDASRASDSENYDRGHAVSVRMRMGRALMEILRFDTGVSWTTLDNSRHWPHALAMRPLMQKGPTIELPFDGESWRFVPLSGQAIKKPTLAQLLSSGRVQNHLRKLC